MSRLPLVSMPSTFIEQSVMRRFLGASMGIACVVS